jgi:hypothetical protein
MPRFVGSEGGCMQIVIIGLGVAFGLFLFAAIG